MSSPTLHSASNGTSAVQIARSDSSNTCSGTESRCSSTTASSSSRSKNLRATGPNPRQSEFRVRARRIPNEEDLFAGSCKFSKQRVVRIRKDREAREAKNCREAEQTEPYHERLLKTVIATRGPVIKNQKKPRKKSLIPSPSKLDLKTAEEMFATHTDWCEPFTDVKPKGKAHNAGKNSVAGAVAASKPVIVKLQTIRTDRWDCDHKQPPTGPAEQRLEAKFVQNGPAKKKLTIAEAMQRYR